MKKFFTLCFLLLVFMLASSSVSKAKENELVLIFNYFNENIEEFNAAYEEKFDVKWDAKYVESVKDVYNISDEKYAYLVGFDKGYLLFDNTMSFLTHDIKNKYPFYEKNEKLYYVNGKFYVKQNNNLYDENGGKFKVVIGNGSFDSDIAHTLDAVMGYDDFSFNKCCTAIPIVSNRFPNNEWGKYKVVSIHQGNSTDCGVIAIMDLLYTYKLTGVANYVKQQSISAMREELRKLTNWQGNIVGEGMLPSDLTRGCRDYINQDGVDLIFAGEYSYVPQIGLYFNLNIKDTAHFALKVGTARNKYFWIFDTNWDIIVSWDRNFEPNSDSMVGEIYNTYSCYYAIDQQYRHGLYTLHKDLVILD